MARLPAEEVLVDCHRREPRRPGAAHAVRLFAGPCHLAHAAKPAGPGVSIIEDREYVVGPSVQVHGVLEAHRRSLEEGGIHGSAGETHDVYLLWVGQGLSPGSRSW